MAIISLSIGNLSKRHNVNNSNVDSRTHSDVICSWVWTMWATTIILNNIAFSPVKSFIMQSCLRVKNMVLLKFVIYKTCVLMKTSKWCVLPYFKSASLSIALFITKNIDDSNNPLTFGRIKLTRGNPCWLQIEQFGLFWFNFTISSIFCCSVELRQF